MSYAKGTPNFNLPQTVGTDKRDWSDTNEAFAKLDSAVQSNTDANASAAENITVLQSDNTTNKTNIAKNTQDISSIQNDITDIKGNVGTNAQGITDANTKITDLRQDSEDMICAYNEPTATSAHYYAVGSYFIYNDILYKATQMINVDDTIVPNVNCSATNVTTELLNQVGGGEGSIRTDLEEMVCVNIEADNTSDHDYATGDIFIYSDKLYRVTAAFNTGDTIVPNTNCVVTSVIAEQGYIKNDVTSVEKQLTATTTSGNIKFQFGVDSDGNYGYVKEGADTVTPFKGTPSPITLTGRWDLRTASSTPTGAATLTIPTDFPYTKFSGSATQTQGTASIQAQVAGSTTWNTVAQNTEYDIAPYLGGSIRIYSSVPYSTSVTGGYGNGSITFS